MLGIKKSKLDSVNEPPSEISFVIFSAISSIELLSKIISSKELKSSFIKAKDSVSINSFLTSVLICSSETGSSMFISVTFNI